MALNKSFELEMEFEVSNMHDHVLNSTDVSNNSTKDELLFQYFSGTIYQPTNPFFQNNAMMYGTFFMQGIGVFLNSYLVSQYRRISKN